MEAQAVEPQTTPAAYTVVVRVDPETLEASVELRVPPVVEITPDLKERLLAAAEDAIDNAR